MPFVDQGRFIRAAFTLCRQFRHHRGYRLLGVTNQPYTGPCQYQRNVCRRDGGRVYAANGVEITMATEAEYDRKVMRVRLKSN